MHHSCNRNSQLRALFLRNIYLISDLSSSSVVICKAVNKILQMASGVVLNMSQHAETTNLKSRQSHINRASNYFVRMRTCLTC